MAIQDEIGIPRSRVTMRYRTEINGVPEDITLPLRILVAGDFSGHDSNPSNALMVGERDLDDAAKRASLEKRTIFNAREIENLVVRTETGDKLTSAQRYNTILTRLNIPSGTKETIEVDDYTKEPSSKKGFIKKIDDFHPKNFDLGPEQEMNTKIANFLSRLSNDRQFYEAVRKNLAAHIAKEPLNDQQELDFYAGESTKTYLKSIQIIYDLKIINSLNEFKDKQETDADDLYRFFSEIQKVKSGGDNNTAITLTLPDSLTGVTEEHKKALTDFDAVVANFSEIGDGKDGFMHNFADGLNPTYQACFDDFKKIQGLKDFLKLDGLPPNVPTKLDSVKSLKDLGVFEFTFDIKASEGGSKLIADLKTKLADKKARNDEAISAHIESVLKQPSFKKLESNWRALEYLVKRVDFSKDIRVDFLDVSKKELAEDFAANRTDIPNSYFFQRIYTDEYDQYGGQPYGIIIGLYEFENTDEDRSWLETMGKIANLSHCPFISSVGAKFFIGEDDIFKLAEIRDLSGHMEQPQFEKWNEFRDSSSAAYLGFTVPKFMIRRPYDVLTNKVGNLNYTEIINDPQDKLKTHNNYCWANSAILFALNLVKSYEETSWCQTIRGPKNGGLIENLPRHVFEKGGITLEKTSVEIAFPDYRELDFAKCGFMALIHKKNSSSACFFSSQSMKKSKTFKDSNDSKNSQLVTNLSYTLSITKIAHYVKCIMRDNIGGSADAAYINKVISTWLNDYVTTVVNPDDSTLRRYPFKAVSVETAERESVVGWYDCKISVLPHLQFEGLDAELRLETRLGKK